MRRRVAGAARRRQRAAEHTAGPSGAPCPDADAGDDPRLVPISTATIRLGQFLKLAGLVETGSGAAQLIADSLVRVNGEIETRRGAQLVPGDRIEIGGRATTVVSAS